MDNQQLGQCDSCEKLVYVSELDDVCCNDFFCYKCRNDDILFTTTVCCKFKRCMGCWDTQRGCVLKYCDVCNKPYCDECPNVFQKHDDKCSMHVCKKCPPCGCKN